MAFGESMLGEKMKALLMHLFKNHGSGLDIVTSAARWSETRPNVYQLGIAATLWCFAG